MPNLNGYELCTKLKQLNPELKVILMSAYDIIECDTSKFTIVKNPILIARLLQIVKDSLKLVVKDSS
jgi:CheY-like chemotaxis protein